MKNLFVASSLLLLAGCALQSAVGNTQDAKVASVVISGSSAQPIGGSSQSLTMGGSALAVSLRALDSAGLGVSGITIAWSSSNPSVATVTPGADGLSATITPVSAGTTVITVNAGVQTAQFTVVVADKAAQFTLAGPDTAAFGGADVTFTVTSTPASAAASAAWTVDADLATLSAATGASVTLHATGVGLARLTATVGGVAQGKGVNLTGLSLSSSPKSASGLVGISQTFTATVAGTGAASAPANRAQWVFTSNLAQCSASPQTGASVTVTAAAAGTCSLTAQLSGSSLVSPAVSLTATAATDIAITTAGTGSLVAGGAGRAYTAAVTSASGPVQGATVAWSYSGPTPPAFSVSAAGLVTPTGVGAGKLVATSSGISRSVGLTVVPGSVAWQETTVTASPSSQTTLHLLVKDANGAAATISSPGDLTAGSGNLTFSASPAFTGVPTGLIGSQGGSLFIGPVTVSANSGAIHTASAAFYGVATTTGVTVNVVAPTVTLAVDTQTPQAGAVLTLTPTVTVGGATSTSTPVTYTVTGDNLFGVTSIQQDTSKPIGQTVLILGRASVTATAGGVTSAPVVLVSRPAGFLFQSSSGAFLGAGATVQRAGSALGIGVSALGVNNNALAVPASATLSITIADPTRASISCTGASCSITGLAETNGTPTSIVASYSSTSGAITATATASVPLAVTAPPAPVWPASGSWNALWTGPRQFSLSFPQASSASGGAVAYNLYAAQGSDPAALFAAGNLVSGNAAFAATVPLTAPSFSSHWTLGVKPVVNGVEGAGKTFTVSVNPAQGLALGSLAFLAGRTAFEVTLDGSKAVHPLAAAAPIGSVLERTAPRASPSGLVGLAANASGQQLWSRTLAQTDLNVAFAGPVLTTDQASCAAASARPTTAFGAVAKVAGAVQPVNVFTFTPNFTTCNRATLVLLPAGGTPIVLTDEVSQATLAGDHVVLVVRKGVLELIDLLQPNGNGDYVEVLGPQVSATAALGGWPAPDTASPTGAGSLEATQATTYDAVNGLLSYALAKSGATYLPPSASAFVAAAQGGALRLVQVGTARVVLETAVHDLVDLSAGGAVTVVPAGLLGNDVPTLGSSYAAGN